MANMNENNKIDGFLNTAREVLLRAGYRTPNMRAKPGASFTHENGFIRQMLVGIQADSITAYQPKMPEDLQRWENEGGQGYGGVLVAVT